MSDAERKATQAKVDAMKEGIQKTIAQINHNYDLEEQAITKREEELKKLRGGMLTSGEQAAIDAMRKANASERDRNTQAAYNAVFAEADAWLEESDREAEEASETLNKELARRTKAWEDYFLKYGTIKERLLAVTTKYNRLINDAETEAERMSLEAERDAILAQYEVETSAWAEELVGKTREQLNTMIDELTAEVEAKEAAFDALDSSTGEDAANYRKQIATLNAQIAALKKRLGEANDAVSSNNWAEATQVFQNIGSAATDAADGIAEFDEELADALRGIAQLASSATNMIGAIQGVMTGVSGIEKASAILAVVGAAIQLVSGIVSGIIATNKEYKETINNFKALNKELEQMNRLAKINSLEGTIFGEDAFGNFVNNLDVMRNATQDFAKSQEAIINRGKEIVNVITGIEEYGTIIENFSWGNIGESLKNMQVLVKDRGKFAESWGAKDKYANLGDMLPELFGDEGVTLEGLQNLQQSDVWDKLSKENRELIEQMIGDWEIYNQSVEAVSNYLKDIFGDFGATMTDILVDSFTQGTDAAIAFGDAMSDIVERLTKDFIYSAFIKDFVDEAQAKVDALNDEELSSEERVRRLVDILKQLSNDVLGAQDEVNNTLAMLDAEGYGIDGVAGQSSSAGGFQAMSQETGSELNGRFTDIQGKVTGINEAVQYIKSLSFSQLQQTTSISETVAQIHNDTSLIEKHTRVLSAIYDKLDKIESNTREL
jgi:hypothetical protein